MPRPGIEVEGLRHTVRNLEAAGADVNDLKAAFTRISRIVSDRADVLAPRRTGKLAASIRTAKTKNRARVSAGKAQVKYANAIHWGWKKHNIKANPFIYKAVDETKPEVLRALDREISAITREHNR
jgi:hypothetical protein